MIYHEPILCKKEYIKQHRLKKLSQKTNLILIITNSINFSRDSVGFIHFLKECRKNKLLHEPKNGKQKNRGVHKKYLGFAKNKKFLQQIDICSRNEWLKTKQKIRTKYLSLIQLVQHTFIGSKPLWPCAARVLSSTTRKQLLLSAIDTWKIRTKKINLPSQRTNWNAGHFKKKIGKICTDEKIGA